MKCPYRTVRVTKFSYPSIRIGSTINRRLLIMCSVFVNHMERIRNTNGGLVDVIVFYPKNYKITTCASANAIGGTIDP